MGAFLAPASAVGYGPRRFAGGMLSRRAHFAVVTFLGRLGGLLFAGTAALAVPAHAVRFPDLLWCALSGAVVLASLYPAVPTVLGLSVLG